MGCLEKRQPFYLSVNSFKQYKRGSIVCFIIMLSVFLFTQCINNQNKKQQDNNNITPAKKINPISFDQFTGSQVCAGCHKEITDNFLQTTHFLTSQRASLNTIKGSFIKGKNNFRYDVDKVVALEKHRDSLYQVYYHNNKEIVRRRFDIVVGSGKNGQTYLSWIGNHIIELPVSYFTQVHQWANSPGYPLSPIIFNRPVTVRCLECHSTYAEAINYNPDVPPVFDSTKLILSVGCEKCHGPAAKHVAYEMKHPNDSIGMFIVNPKRLSKQLSLDVCALCHSGRLQETKPPFHFTAGDSLSDFFEISDAAKKAGIMDVHGNQLGVLSASKCFQLSKTMTCITCHNPHKSETGNTVVFSQRCINCHTGNHTSVEGVTNNELINNCIDCHMPLQESTSISFLLQKKEKPVNAIMRTHYITVYADATKKFIESNASSKKKKP